MKIKYFVILVLAFALSLSAKAQNAVISQGDSLIGSPVLFKGDTVMFLQYSMGEFTAEQRAESANERLSEILTLPYFSGDSFRMKQTQVGYLISYGSLPILTVIQDDSIGQQMDAASIANLVKTRLKEISDQTQTVRTVKRVLLGILWAVLTLAVLIFLVKGVNRVFPLLYLKIRAINESKIKSIKFQSIEIISATRIYTVVLWLAQGLKIFVLILLFYFFIPAILGYFPATQHLAGKLVGYILAPLKAVFSSFFSYLPNLFYIAVIVTVTYYILKGIRWFFREIQKGNLSFPGFYVDWATPTFNIVRVVVLIFAAIVIFPYLPGSDSPVFQGISVFVGLLVSFGSGSAIANAFSGIVLTYMRPFKVGDRVKIADAVGDVFEKTLLVTRIRTIKNVDITIPNVLVLGSHIINFSSSERKEKLIVHTTITIGYDVPWRKVHSLLKDCAFNCEMVEKLPEPFVLQTSLDDFYVSYELNAYTSHANKMAVIHSELHQLIQDKFNEAGVEIMSPHYGAQRDGNMTTIPGDYLPPDYEPPSFRLFNYSPAKKKD